MLCPPFFLMEIGEVKIRTTNPQFFASVRSLAFSRHPQFNKIMDFVAESKSQYN
jgi:hypothetical protein